MHEFLQHIADALLRPRPEQYPERGRLGGRGKGRSASQRLEQQLHTIAIMRAVQSNWDLSWQMEGFHPKDKRDMALLITGPLHCIENENGL